MRACAESDLAWLFLSQSHTPCPATLVDRGRQAAVRASEPHPLPPWQRDLFQSNPPAYLPCTPATSALWFGRCHRCGNSMSAPYASSIVPGVMADKATAEHPPNISTASTCLDKPIRTIGCTSPVLSFAILHICPEIYLARCPPCPFHIVSHGNSLPSVCTQGAWQMSFQSLLLKACLCPAVYIARQPIAHSEAR